jgi:hypothetical protein
MHFVSTLHGAQDVLTLVLVFWMLWLTRQMVDIRERLSKLSGELEVIRNNRKVVLSG